MLFYGSNICHDLPLRNNSLPILYLFSLPFSIFFFFLLLNVFSVICILLINQTFLHQYNINVFVQVSICVCVCGFVKEKRLNFTVYANRFNQFSLFYFVVQNTWEMSSADVEVSASEF